MGVRCTAVENATLVRECSTRSLSEDDWDSMYDNDQRYLVNVDAFKERGDGMVDGIYQTAGASEHYDASYGGYNRFRAMLCREANGFDPEVIWEGDWSKMERLPFAPLINFADNEGFLGPKTCARLAADAALFPDLSIVRFNDYDEWPVWVRMFNIAADTGVIYYS